ncbi:UPAR/Ly6 domain-containing protein crok [Lepeophtheirus salmonis]|uniref:Uncharacterized protein n=1 Tax=Lepeophtheirus salmonis TaxID=72036 RepID=A0A0K2THV7_LEPSM|nr:uncharacterized protein LOC121127950 [Lepeophtheirus salmonis]
MNRNFIFFSLAVLAISFIDSGSSIQCHQCSTYDEKECGDPFVNDDGSLKSDKFLSECPEEKYTLCRKTYQNVRGEVSVIRSCGYEEYKNECYKTVLEEYNTLVCTCKEDGCNPASVASTSTFLLGSSLLLAFIMRQ